MPNLTTMTYGSYNFSPVPFITLNKENIVNKEGILGTKYVITLNGTLSTSPTLNGGIENVDSLQDSLMAGLNQNGLRFELKCGSTSLLVCYPKINFINFSTSTNNWVYTTPYTIELEFEDYSSVSNAPYIDECNETWNVEFVEESSKYTLELSGVTDQEAGYYYDKDCNYIILRVNHSLNAVGQQNYYNTGTGITGVLEKDAWQYARDWCIDRLGFDSGILQDSGVLNLRITGAGGIASYYPYNHMRITSRSETQGSYSVEENWLIALSGSGDSYSGSLRANEDFNVDIAQQQEDDMTQATIQGTIQGWETRDYGTNPDDFSITESKIQSAEAYWNIIKMRLLPRVQLYTQGISNRSINVLPIAKTVGYLPSKGVINYSYTYDDRPILNISGALAEMITIDHNLATDVTASLPIIGRTAGAIVQSMNTYTNPTLTVNVECTMPRSTGTGLAGLMANIPRTQVNELLCQFQADLTGNWASVHVTDNKENWIPTTSRYSRTITWLYTLCSGNIFSGVC
jgi:hypothetical protein